MHFQPQIHGDTTAVVVPMSLFLTLRGDDEVDELCWRFFHGFPTSEETIDGKLMCGGLVATAEGSKLAALFATNSALTSCNGRGS